jgi:hypothetical protein
MKKQINLLIILCCLFTSCEEGNREQSYTEITTAEFNTLCSPVILISKSENFGLYGVTLLDCKGMAIYFGNLSSFANGIGQHYIVGDTIK